MSVSRTVVSCGLTIVLAVALVARSEEKDPAAALAKAPAAVQTAAKKALGNKKLEEVDKEIVGGKTLYEIGFKVGDVDHAYIINEAGELIQEEADVETSKLPGPVTDAVKTAQPKGKITEAAMATSGDKHFYVVDVKVNKETHALKITEAGKLIADDIEKSAPDNAEENEKKE